MINYVSGLKSQIDSTISTTLQDLTIQQQDFVQVIRKCDLIYLKTDGKILETGEPRIYNITETDMVSESSTYQPADTYIEFQEDFKTLQSCIEEFNNNILLTLDISDDGTSFYNEGDFKMANENNFTGLNNKYFFMIMSRIFNDKNKKEEFKKKIISGSLLEVKSPINLRKKFDDYVDDLAEQYSDELDNEEKKFKNLKKSKQYKDLIEGITEKMYPKGKYRKFDYTTVPDEEKIAQQTQEVINLYKTVNINTNENEWTNKIKFT
jgi:hypothetical protein